MKNNKSLDEYVKERLIEWAEWYKQGGYAALGYPRRNILARLREEGGLLISGTGNKIPPSNLAVEEVEGLVKKLAEQQPKRAEVLRIYYFYQYDHEVKAKKCGYSKTQYYFNLKMAHEWIKGYFSANKKLSR